MPAEPENLERYEHTTTHAIARAVAAERERCAKIAEGWHPMMYAPEQEGRHPRDAAYRDAKDAIATAIRNKE